MLEYYTIINETIVAHDPIRLITTISYSHQVNAIILVSHVDNVVGTSNLI